MISSFKRKFLIFSFCICKLALAYYMINEIQPKRKFQICPMPLYAIIDKVSKFQEIAPNFTYSQIVIIRISLDQLPLPYQFRGSGMRRILFFLNFLSCKKVLKLTPFLSIDINVYQAHQHD